MWTAVYRLFDADCRLLYVGIGSDYLARWKSHALRYDWWASVARKEVTWYDNRLDAAYDESRAITDENPLHNRRPGIDPLGLAVFRCEDRYGRTMQVPAPSLTTSSFAADRLLGEPARGTHALVAYEGVPIGVYVPIDWYRRAAEAVNEPTEF